VFPLARLKPLRPQECVHEITHQENRQDTAKDVFQLHTSLLLQTLTDLNVSARQGKKEYCDNDKEQVVHFPSL
jgi:hypothetical protein